jgi:hypothetical protein
MLPKDERTDRVRVLLMSLRQALIIALGALEDYLRLERSIVPRRKRKDIDEHEKQERIEVR